MKITNAESVIECCFHEQVIISFGPINYRIVRVRLPKKQNKEQLDT